MRDEHFGSWSDENAAPNNSARDAGAVASFSNGMLTLRLNDGSMVSGRVTDAPEIKCEPVESQEMEHARHADGDHRGGSNGSDHNGNNGNNGNNGDQGEYEPGAPICSSANLGGVVVRDAKLTVSGTGATWQEVELAKQNQ